MSAKRSRSDQDEGRNDGKEKKRRPDMNSEQKSSVRAEAAEAAAAPDASATPDPFTLNVTFDRASYGAESKESGRAIVRTVISCSEEEEENPPRAPASLAISVDDSGSMHSAVHLVRRSCEFILRSWQDQQGQVGITKFSEEALTVRPMQAVTGATIEADVASVNHHIRASGATNLCAGVLAGLNMLQATPATEPRVLILVSDGLPSAGVMEAQEIRRRIQEHPAFPGCMLFSLAIGDSCDTTTLQMLSSVSAGGSLFEITRSANPATVIGVMAGLVAYQRLRDVSITVPGIVGVPARPQDLSGIHSIYEEEHNRLTYRIGNMAAGEKRTILTSIPLPDSHGPFHTTVTARTRHFVMRRRMLFSQRVEASFLGYGAPGGPQDPVTGIEVVTLEGLELLVQGRDAQQVRDFMARTLPLVEGHDGSGEQEVQGAVDRLKALRTRMSWFLEMDGEEEAPSRLRLLRATTTEVREQRVTTHQATQAHMSEAKEEEEDEGDGLTPNLPSLTRAFSEHATQFSQDPHSLDPCELVRSDGHRVLRRADAMGEAGLRALLEQAASDEMPPPLPVMGLRRG